MAHVIVKKEYMGMIAHFRRAKEECDARTIVLEMEIVWEVTVIVTLDFMGTIVNKILTSCAQV